MTAPTLDTEPACPSAADPPAERSGSRPILSVTPGSVASIPRDTWDALVRRNPMATPFSSWAFHRAWWDAYGANATEQTLLVCGEAGEPIAIVPLMRRHEVEPLDADLHTMIRHGTDLGLTPVAPTASALFFGASYHADYATLIGDPADFPAVAAATARHLSSPAAGDWDVVDLRRIRCADPAGDALAAAFGAVEVTRGWTLNVDREDVCPVVTFPAGASMEGYLETLGKKERHEIRRKVRRAEATGRIELTDSGEPLRDLETFIDLHQRRWGEAGLFPDTAGGVQSRVLFRRMFELFGAAGPLRLSFLSVGGRRIAAGVHFETREGLLYYNAGIDPDARDLSPGVLTVYAYVQRALRDGLRRLDFLRGDEPYKYEWGAIDEPIQRILVRRDP
jgi:CelD/BcsL family acetyltransferase involved in cellulose biosynthesis